VSGFFVHCLAVGPRQRASPVVVMCCERVAVLTMRSPASLAAEHDGLAGELVRCARRGASPLDLAARLAGERWPRLLEARGSFWEKMGVFLPILRKQGIHRQRLKLPNTSGYSRSLHKIKKAVFYFKSSEDSHFLILAIALRTCWRSHCGHVGDRTADMLAIALRMFWR